MARAGVLSFEKIEPWRCWSTSIWFQSQARFWYLFFFCRCPPKPGCTIPVWSSCFLCYLSIYFLKREDLKTTKACFWGSGNPEGKPRISPNSPGPFLIEREYTTGGFHIPFESVIARARSEFQVSNEYFKWGNYFSQIVLVLKSALLFRIFPASLKDKL